MKPSQPPTLLQREVTLNPRDMIGALAELAQGNWLNASQKFIEGLGLKGNTVEEAAWRVVLKALLKACKNLVRDTNQSLDTNPKNVDIVSDELARGLEASTHVLTGDLFRHPKRLDVLKPAQAALEAWGVTYGLTEAEAQKFSERLPDYFAEALFEVSLEYPEDYALLKDSLADNLFALGREVELAWERYQHRLSKLMAEPVMDEAFSLRSIYLPLRAYYERETTNRHRQDDRFRLDKDKVVVDAEASLDAWLNAPQDFVRVVSGGPGSGKSTLAKHFAAKRSEAGHFKVLFIPLHKLQFDGDLATSVRAHLADLKLFPNGFGPLAADDPRLLVVLDGLDELSMLGPGASRAVADLVREVEQKAPSLNQSRTVKFLLTGRASVVQEEQVRALRRAGDTLELLPYYVRETARRQYIDEDKRLKHDQRHEWWGKYGSLKGLAVETLPAKLNLHDHHHLTEITAQPILNYLVAWNYLQDPQAFNPNENINQLYETLFNSIYERRWGEGGNLAVKGLERHDFMLIYECIGLATWHAGDTRTARVKDIIAKLSPPSLKDKLTAIEDGIEEGAARVLAAFYTRRGVPDDEGNKTFELTHKSFGEYLTARRLVRGVELLHRKFTEVADDQWTLRDALVSWIKLAGPGIFTYDLGKFIRREVALSNSDKAAVQATLTELLRNSLDRGLPMEEGDTGGSFVEMDRQARNVWEGLLVMHSAYAGAQPEPQKPRLSEDDRRVRALVNYLASCPEHPPKLNLPLAFLNLDRVDLRGINLNGADFKEADLRGAFFTRAALAVVSFEGADLSNANFDSALVDGSDFRRVNLRKANLRNSRLSPVNLSGADLSGADLSEADLSDANLFEVNLSGATLVEADLLETNLNGADLRGVKGVTVDQLMLCHSLYRAKLDDHLRSELEQRVPDLFEK